MGFTNVMKLQENPDGIDGHFEREVFQEVSKCAPAKQRFTEGRDFHTYTVPTITKAQQRVLDLQIMKSRCEWACYSCCIKNCPTCHRPSRLERKERASSRNQLISLNAKDAERLTRGEFFNTRISRQCPLTHLKHKIKDCVDICPHCKSKVCNNNSNAIDLWCSVDPDEKWNLYPDSKSNEVKL